MKLLKKIEMECTEDGHAKFWMGSLYSDNSVTTSWGKIGNEPRTKSFPNAGEEFLDKKVLGKERKGYEVA